MCLYVMSAKQGNFCPGIFHTFLRMRDRTRTIISSRYINDGTILRRNFAFLFHTVNNSC